MDGLLPVSAIPGPRRFSLLGSIHAQTKFDRDPIRAMTDLRSQYGNLVRYENMLGHLLFAFGPEYNHALHTDTELFLSRPFVLPGPKGSAQHRLRQSIFCLNGQTHRRMRHQLLPPFQRSIMPRYHPEIVRLVGQMLASWKPGEQRELHHEMLLLVWSVIRKLLFGLDETDASESLLSALQHWMFQTFSPWVRSFPFNLPFTPYRKLQREAEHLEQHFLRLMQAKRDEGLTGTDVLSQLLKFRHQDGALASDHDMVGHAMTLFLVAYETTGNTLTWTLFLLAQHPEIQQELLDELAPWRGAVPSCDELDTLPLLDRVLKESMRILPAVPYSRRLASRDASIGPYVLPKKTRVIFSNYITHHMPEVFPHPERFWPQRWERIKPTPSEYLPFGAGLRTCLGSVLAQQVLKISLAQILPAWKITVLPNAQIDRRLGISLGPNAGIPILISRQDRRLQASDIRGNIHEMVELLPTPVWQPLRLAA